MDNLADLLKKLHPSLTQSERLLADVILRNYPASGLGSITDLAQQSQVSTATVARFVKKLGCEGFSDFQAKLRKELNDKISGPINKHERWVERLPDEHIINRYTDSVISNIQATMANMDVNRINLACELIADTKRELFVVGGRITRILADHFFLHMQVVRKDVTLISSNSNAWPHYLLDLKAGDILVVYDVRRYETSTQRLAEFARERGAEIILLTDQWQSPIGQQASVILSNRIEVPAAWDSLVTCLMLNETIIADVQERLWNQTRNRMEELEGMFDRTLFFRKF